MTPPPPDDPGKDWPNMDPSAVPDTDTPEARAAMAAAITETQEEPDDYIDKPQIVAPMDPMVAVAAALTSLANSQAELGKLLAGKFAGSPGVPAEFAGASVPIVQSGFAEKIGSIHFATPGTNRMLCGEIKMSPRGGWRPVEHVPDHAASLADFLKRGNTTELSPHGCRIRVIEDGQTMPRLEPWPLWDLLPGGGGGLEAVLEQRRMVDEGRMATMAGASQDAF